MSESIAAKASPVVDPKDLDILGRVSRADIHLEPYPHVLVHDALPQAVYDSLAASFPTLEYVARDEAPLNNKACLRGAADVVGDPAVGSMWQAFFDYHLSQAFFARFVDVWGDTVERVHPGILENFGKPLADFEVGTRATGKGLASANREPDIVLDCVFGVNTPVRTATAVRGPHIDSPYKLFSSLLYFRLPEDRSTGGEYELYESKRRMYPKRLLKKIPARYVRPVKAVPYRANTLLFWLNSAVSIHGVSPRQVTPLPRRYVAVMGECYGGRNREGFFGHHPEWDSSLGRVRSWLNV
jgi:hypothetical protein